jgi:aspartate/methionine/tyrosine aminotransferase
LDFDSPAHYRELYRQNFQLAEEILGVETPPATFYIWLKVSNDIHFTIEAYKRGVKVLPGRFLGRKGAGKGFVRLALVYPPHYLRKPLEILRGLL